MHPSFCGMFLAVAMVLSQNGFAQWTDVTELYTLPGTTQASYLGTGLSVADFNRDGLDDITVANSDGTTVVYAQVLAGGYNEVHFIDGTEQVQGVVWFDVDGDEDLDLMLTRRFAPMQLFLNTDGELIESAELRGLPIDENWESRGIAVADYDDDGDLDAYVCMYHDGSSGLSENLLFNNNGLGFFTDVTVSAGVGNGLQHSFQASWLDFDEDGDLDLWVINDRTLFANAMYRNNGDGTFDDVALEFGLSQQIFAMTSTVGDPDNDGEFELFCSNVEDNANILLDKAPNGIFYEVGEPLGLDGMQYSWGGCWVDVDGDMSSDLMVATYRFPNALPYQNYYYKNHDGGSFYTDETEEYWPNNMTQLYSLAACDFNQDLAPDVIALGNNTYLQMLENATAGETGINERLAVQLCGTYSNRWAIGAEIRVHAAGTSQLQLVSCGTDYATQQSWKRYFGLGTADIVDSVEVEWPSGLHEVWYDIPVRSDLQLIEGSTTASLTVSGNGCAGDSTWLRFPLSSPNIAVNGLSVAGDSLLLEESGIYAVDCSWMGGLFHWTDTLEWEEAEPHALTIQWSEPPCYGGTGQLGWSTDPALNVAFEGDNFSHAVQGLPAAGGALTLNTLDSAGICSQIHEFDLSQPTPLELFIDYSPALCFEDTAHAFATGYGGTPNYFLDWGGADPAMLTEGTVLLNLEDANGCVVDSLIEVDIPEPLSCDVEVTPENLGNDGALTLNPMGGVPPYDILWNTGDQGDTVIDGLTEGLYSWVITDANGCLLLGLQDLVNMGVDRPLLHEACRLSQGPEGLWFVPGVSMDGLVQVDIYDVQGRRVYSEEFNGKEMRHWSWEVLPQHGIVWVHDTQGETYFRSAY